MARSWIGTMFGCSRRAVSWASWTRRSMARGCPARSGASVFSAICRRSLGSSARWTELEPPTPISPWSTSSAAWGRGTRPAPPARPPPVTIVWAVLRPPRVGPMTMTEDRAVAPIPQETNLLRQIATRLSDYPSSRLSDLGLLPLVVLAFLRPRDAVAVQLRHEGAARDAELLGGAGLAPDVGLQRGQDLLAVGDLLRIAQRRQIHH